jgi:DNA-binding CsgD family transcriptional regulator
VGDRVLVGRTAELAALAAAFGRARAGEPELCLLTGESGVGKTALLTAAAAQIAAGGGRVLVGGCVPAAAGELPYAPLLEAFRGTPVGLGQHAGPSRTYELFLRDLAALARERPLLVAIEDLHWADRSTVDLLAFLARNLRDEPVLLLLTCRSDQLAPADPVRRWLAELPRLRPPIRLELPRLDRAGTAEQIAALLDAPPEPELVDAVHARSEGNPLVTEALVEAAGTDLAAIPGSLRELVLGRLAALPRPAHALLRLSAVAGRQVRHEVLAALAGLPETEVLAALRAAVDAHVLVPDGDSYGFRHAMVREVIYDDLLPAERRHLHAGLAGALDAEAEQAEVAHHWYCAGDLDRALPATVRAGLDALRRYAFVDALHHLERALSVWPATPRELPPRAEIAAAAGQAAALLGEEERAIALTREAYALTDPDAQPCRAAQLLNQLGRTQYAAGRRAEALAAYREALRLLDPLPPGAERAHALAGLAKIHVAWSDTGRGRWYALQAIAAARLAGAAAEEGRARHVLGLVLAHDGDTDAGLAELREGLRIARELDDPDAAGQAYINTCYVLSLAGRAEEAIRVAREGHRECVRLGVARQYGGFLLANAGGVLFRCGRWEEAARELAAAQASGTRGPRAYSLLLNTARLHTGRGDFAGTRTTLARMAEVLDGGGFTSWRRGYLEQVAELALWEDRPEAARDAVARGLAVDPGEPQFAGALLALGLRAEADLAERAGAARDRSGVDAALAAGEALAARLESFDAGVLPEHAAEAATARAELSRLRAEGTAGRWQEAAAAWQRLDRPYPRAYALLRAAQVLLPGDQPAGTRALREAYATARRLRAAPLEAACARLARWHRVPLEAPARPPAKPAGRVLLTPREREILALVADGHSNGQIARALVISPKTASVHVSNILRKLGATGRADAARIAHHLNLSGSPAGW